MTEPYVTTSRPAEELESTALPLRLCDRYRQDHRHPINHFLHIGVGWPLAGGIL